MPIDSSMLYHMNTMDPWGPDHYTPDKVFDFVLLMDYIFFLKCTIIVVLI